MPSKPTRAGPAAGVQVVRPANAGPRPGAIDPNAGKGGGSSAGQWIKDQFASPKLPGIPGGPSASQIYSGPQAFQGYGGAAASTGNNQAAVDALRQMQGIASTGWTPADRQAQQQSATQAAQQEQGQRGAVEQQAAARGQYGGGMQMMGALAAQQGGANRAASTASDIASRGADRRMGATQAVSQMGNEFANQAFQRGSSADQFNQWASGQQTGAVMGAYGAQMDQYTAQMEQYQAKVAEQNKWWDRISGLIGG